MWWKGEARIRSFPARARGAALSERRSSRAPSSRDDNISPRSIRKRTFFPNANLLSMVLSVSFHTFFRPFRFLVASVETLSSSPKHHGSYRGRNN